MCISFAAIAGWRPRLITPVILSGGSRTGIDENDIEVARARADAQVGVHNRVQLVLATNEATPPVRKGGD